MLEDAGVQEAMQHPRGSHMVGVRGQGAATVKRRLLKAS